jgi:hypothetical protein
MCAIEEIGTGNLEYLKEEKGEEKVPITQGQKTDSNLQIRLGLRIRTP